MSEHINEDGAFQSDKVPGCPAGYLPLSFTDELAQDLIDTYAERKRPIDPEFSHDVQTALATAGYSLPLGEMLRRKRGDRSLIDVGKEIGISGPWLSQLEKGAAPNLKDFAAICDWLQIDPGDALAKLQISAASGA